MEKIELAYIGQDFYLESSTVMSPLIPVGETGNIRWDWSGVQRALANGHEISIRPANHEELGKAYLRLQEIKQELKRPLKGNE